MLVVSYSEDTLAELLSNAHTSKSVILSKNHFTYFKEYLSNSRIDAKTIVIEDEYISRDYLQDYASYYSLCFEKYDKFCKRLHFFSAEFNQEVFESIVTSNEEDSQIWGNYIGFIVVKPIPVTTIGISILKTYSNSKDYNSRHFWGIRKYPVHLFGKKLAIYSLAFQEQDSVVAACATTAIWSMLNKASQDYYTKLKSPSEITKDADKVSSDGSRLFPNRGLNILQISQAIFNAGLVCEIKQHDSTVTNQNGDVVDHVISNSYLKKIINAYSPIGIPIILVINVPDGNQYGLHAVAVSGYKKAPPIGIQPRSEISYLSENITKLYAHDDQWGPFVRLNFISPNKIETPWSIFHPSNNPTYVKNIIVPLFPKIRISYEDIDVITLGLDRILSFFFQQKTIEDLVWDIKLRYSEEFKSIIKEEINLNSSEKLKILTANAPKYLWVVSCFISESKIFDFTFDATDVKSGMIGLHVIPYLDSNTLKTLNNFLSINKPILDKIFRHPSSTSYYDFIIEETK